MKRMSAITVFSVMALTAGAAQAACELGPPPSIPDGSSANQEQMMEAATAVKTYMAETQDYMSCLEFEGKGRSGGSWTKKYNEAADQMEKLASEYNQQLKTFKAR